MDKDSKAATETLATASPLFEQFKQLTKDCYKTKKSLNDDRHCQLLSDTVGITGKMSHFDGDSMWAQTGDDFGNFVWKGTKRDSHLQYGYNPCNRTSNVTLRSSAPY